MSAATPTPTPWHTGEDENRADGPGIVRDAEGRPVAYFFISGGPSGNESAGNAALVVRAVNSHQALLEALEKISEQFCESDDCVASADARAALALAKGEGA